MLLAGVALLAFGIHRHLMASCHQPNSQLLGKGFKAAVGGGYAGVEALATRLNGEGTRVVCWAGDGGTYDIGMASLSGQGSRRGGTGARTRSPRRGRPTASAPPRGRRCRPH